MIIKQLNLVRFNRLLYYNKIAGEAINQSREMSIKYLRYFCYYTKTISSIVHQESMVVISYQINQ